MNYSRPGSVKLFKHIAGMNLLQLKSYFLLASILLINIVATAQDSTKKKEVSITSTFKPSLKEAAKINFNAATPVTDTTRPVLQYNVPDQNMAFAFLPGSLKPLALQVDTGGRWNNQSFIKLGYGNLNTPYLQGVFSTGDGRTAGLNAEVKHISSNGQIKYQDYSNTNIDLNAFFQTSKNLEWDARLGAYQEKYNKYGFEPKTLSFSDDSLNVKFQTWRGRLSFHNINKTEYGLSYAPEIKVDVFNDQLSNSESNTWFNFPLEKSLGKTFAIDLALAGNLSRYKPQDKTAIVNNFIEVSPSLFYKTSNINIQAGIKPSWDNGNFKLFPNIMAEFNSTDKRISFQLGWLGHLRNSGYQYVAELNPWIWAPANVYNTRIEEGYAGFKGSIGDHFSYSAKIGYGIYNNQPLFVNDTMSGKSFIVVNEPEMKVGNFNGQIGYTVGEKFSLISSLTLNQYVTKVNEKAWGLIPSESKTDLRLLILKDLYLNSTLYIFDGPFAPTKSGVRDMPMAYDLSAGLEFRITKYIKLWTQFNNIFNQPYERWNQYPVYGFNFLGGVVFSFGQKK
jgi:hypothetical protein